MILLSYFLVLKKFMQIKRYNKLPILAIVAIFIADISMGTASTFLFHQPKVPGRLIKKYND